jgi:hypothetical protein
MAELHELVTELFRRQICSKCPIRCNYTEPNRPFNSVAIPVIKLRHYESTEISRGQPAGLEEIEGTIDY